MDEKKTISNAEMRRLLRELESGRMTVGATYEHLSLFSKDPDSLIRFWKKRFSPEISFTLPLMSEIEKQKLDAVTKRMKELEDAQMKHIALETMIEIAEEKLRIDIRKKPEPKR